MVCSVEVVETVLPEELSNCLHYRVLHLTEIGGQIGDQAGKYELVLKFAQG